MLPRLSLPLLPPLALPTPSRPPLKLLTIDAQDDSSAPKIPKAGSLGRPTSHPLTIEQAAAKRASRDFERIRTEVNRVLAEHDGTDATKLLALLRKRLGRIIDTPELRKWAAARVAEIARFNAGQVSRSVGIKVPELLNKATQQRLTNRVIASARGVPREVVNRIAPVVRQAIATGQRGPVFEADIAEKLGVSHKRARRSAIGAVLRANSALTEERHQALGIVEYIWRSSRDRLTRRWHRKLDGQRVRYDSPPMGGGGGPHDVGHAGDTDTCRCQKIPVIPERLKALPGSAESKPTPTKPTGSRSPRAQPERVSSWMSKGLRDFQVPQSGMRPQSLEYLRGGGKPVSSLPVMVNVFADGKTHIVDGRHRITIARERGETHLDNVTVRFLGPRGGVLRQYVTRIPI